MPTFFNTQVFTHPYALRMHQETHGGSEAHCECVLCGFVAATRDRMSRHLGAAHPEMGKSCNE